MSTPSDAVDRRKNTLGRPREHDRSARIESLLDVATEVFTERGFKGASLDEIASRAGASKQTFYSRYASKSELFKAVIHRETEGAHLRFSDILLSNQPFEDVLQRFGLELIQRIEAERSRRLIRTLTACVDSFPELAKGLWAQISEVGVRSLAEYVHGQIRKGFLKTLDPDLAAHVFTGLVLGPYYLPAQLGVEPALPLKDRRTYVKEAVRVFLCAFASAEWSGHSKRDCEGKGRRTSSDKSRVNLN
jgi:AcrR family transcriptional regulator